MTAWIMVDSKGFPFTRNMFDLSQGFSELGEEVKTYNASDVFADTIPATENDIVVGHIQQCRNYVFKICGKTIPNLDYPEELIPFMQRKFWKATLGDIYSMVTLSGNIDPLFVKTTEQKFVTGFVCKNFSDYVKNCSGVDHKTEIFVSEVVEFKAEFRAYIHRHQIVNALRYKGDYDVAPSKKTLEAMLYALRNTKMPIAYSIDVGILPNGETVLVECNDGFALGNYGVYARKYAEMHRDRWYQMIRE
jgi:hypothetical protein